MRSGRWLKVSENSRARSLALICVPYAGGGPSAFRDWHEESRFFDIVTVHLPGRESRIAEPAFTSLQAIIDNLARALCEFEQDFALFGHSMGGIIAFELARALDRAGCRGPKALFIASCPPPHWPRATQLHALPTDELLESLSSLGGISPEVLEQRDLLDLMVPTLRSDLAIVDDYSYLDGKPLTQPIHVFTSDGDPQCGVSEMRGWRLHTTGEFTLTQQAGDHFFPFRHVRSVLDNIERQLNQLARVP
jgi:surfactin synthase thioesterase subunit